MHTFKVPPGMMKDIVRPLYEQRVLAVGQRVPGQKEPMLQVIDSVE